MKATGIVRRIDDLGRVVVPKEIRRTLRIREGDPLEIFTDREGEIILKKYSPIGELSAFAGQYAESLAQTAGCLACICDMDQVVAASGAGKKDLADKYISSQLGKIGKDLKRADSGNVSGSGTYRRADRQRTGTGVCRRDHPSCHLRRRCDRRRDPSCQG